MNWCSDKEDYSAQDEGKGCAGRTGWGVLLFRIWTADKSHGRIVRNRTREMDKELKYNLPGNHVDITDKKETLDLSKILNEDCELILFELPKNFDKEKFP